MKNIDVKIFSQIESIKFGYGYYDHDVCPYVFKNAIFKGLSFTNIETDLMTNQIFKIMDLDERECTGKIHTVILYLALISANHLHLTAKLFSSCIFANMRDLTVQGQFKNIDEDFFKSIPQIKKIEFSFTNMRNFLHSSNNIWMKNMHSNGFEYANKSMMIEAIESNKEMFISFQMSDYNTNYFYPGEDFCLFKYFPYKKAILFFINFENDGQYDRFHRLSDKCTFYFLTQNFFLINFYTFTALFRRTNS